MSNSLRDSITKAFEEQEIPAVDSTEQNIPSKETENHEPDTELETSEVSEGAVDTKDDDHAVEEKLDAPQHWANKDKEIFASLSKEGQEFLLRRHKEMESSFTKKNQTLSEEVKFAENIRNKIGPYEHYLKQHNIDPATAFEMLLATEVKLRSSSPEEKARLIQDLAVQYGAQYNPNHEYQDIDPQQQAILNRLAQQEIHLTRIENEKIRSEEKYLQNTINDFISIKDDKGQPKYPHFDEVRSDMAILLNAGKAQDLQEAYEQAIYLNPELRKDYLMKQVHNERRASDSRSKSEAAKRAGFNVKSRSTASIIDQPEPLGLRETLLKAYDSQLSSVRI